MGSGYGAGYADVIEEKSIKKMCPKEWEKFMEAISDADVTVESVAMFISQDNDLPLDEVRSEGNAVAMQKAIWNSWVDLHRAFKKKTKLGLDIGYHDSDSEGDRYDDIDGVFFCVYGMYQLSPAGKKMKKFVDRKFYVTFG